MSILKRFFTKSPEVSHARVEVGTPHPDKRVYVIGDLHGCFELFEELAEKVRIHANEVPHIVVCVGDFIDRGERSADVLNTLKNRASESPHSWICLLGNHEKMMLEFLDTPQEKGQRWLRNGGLQTLASFGVGGVTETSGGDALEMAAKNLEQAAGSELIGWVRKRPLFWSSGNLWVVHGAAHPEAPMDEQEERHLLWGHSSFLRTPRSDGIWVAHGHTVTDHPEFANSRIATDTGAYFTGKLTAACIDPDGTVDFLQT